VVGKLSHYQVIFIVSRGSDNNLHTRNSGSFQDFRVTTVTLNNYFAKNNASVFSSPMVFFYQSNAVTGINKPLTVFPSQFPDAYDQHS
jgi:hypothetical protein